MGINRIDLGTGEEEPDIRCPHCNRRLAPPDLPYCEHVVYAHIDTTYDDGGFDHVASWFAPRYLRMIEASGYLEEEDIELSGEARKRFIAADLPPFHQQSVPLWWSEDLFQAEEEVTVIRYTLQEHFGTCGIEVVVIANPGCTA